MISWTGLAPWELESPFPGSLISTFGEQEVLYPLLMSGRSKDPGAVNKEIADVFHRFLSQVLLLYYSQA